jgi:hypothetical protein
MRHATAHTHEKGLARWKKQRTLSQYNKIAKAVIAKSKRPGTIINRKTFDFALIK